MSEEKKSCRTCAYQRFNFFNNLKFWTCRYDKSSIKEDELDTKLCENYLRKKEGMTLKQQIEEKAREQKQKQEAEEKARLTKEYNKLSNRLKRNWYYVCALVIAGIGLIIVVWRLIFGI